MRVSNLGFSLPAPADIPVNIGLESYLVMLPFSHSCAFKDVKNVDEIFTWNYFLVCILATENIGNTCFPTNKAETL